MSSQPINHPLSALPFTLTAIRAAYRQGLRPADLISEVYRRIQHVADDGIFIHLADADRVRRIADSLGSFNGEQALWGMPFVVKDNIDVAGMPTTAGCPDYTYAPERDATVVSRLRAAGAIPVGKTNLDQFATGLVGVRTPYPVPRNARDPQLVPGGSSAGSAVAVAHGIVPFGLATDTAGSGRVPAALNGIVGLKPTPGLVPSVGVIPACRSLDTVSILASNVPDASKVLQVVAGVDPDDPYSRTRTDTDKLTPGRPLVIGLPDKDRLCFDGDALQAQKFADDVAVINSLDFECRTVDLAPFLEVAELLYGGPWIAERYVAVEALIRQQPDVMHPVTRSIIQQAERFTAVDTFKAMYHLKALQRCCETALDGVDVLCVPSIPRPVSMQEIQEDPISPNNLLGTYTNFVNLLGLAAITVPTAPRADGLPGSLTLIARVFSEDMLVSTAQYISLFANSRREMYACG